MFFLELSEAMILRDGTCFLSRLLRVYGDTVGGKFTAASTVEIPFDQCEELGMGCDMGEHSSTGVINLQLDSSFSTTLVRSVGMPVLADARSNREVELIPKRMLPTW